MNAKVIPFRKAQKRVAADPQREQAEPKPRQPKMVTGDMMYALEVAMAMFEGSAPLQKQAQALGQIHSILSNQGGWMVFHKSRISVTSVGETDAELVFRGWNASAIEGMLCGRQPIWNKRQALAEDKKAKFQEENPASADATQGRRLQ